jgi:hypothetical protein
LQRRFVSDMLPEYETARFFAWQIAGGDVTKWRRVCRTCTEYDVYDAYSMMRTAKYLSEEKE